jgi:hypothetical protein
MERKLIVEVLGTTRADVAAVRRWEADGAGRGWSGSRAVLTVSQRMRCAATDEHEAVRRCCAHVEAECRAAGVGLLHVAGAVQLPTEQVAPLEHDPEDHGWLRGTGAFRAHPPG